MIRRFTHQKYQCKAGHESLIFVEDTKRMKTQKCQVCGKKAEHVFITTQREAIKATVIYERPGENGKVERMYVDPKVPESCAIAEREGYQRREIQGLHEMRRFERDVTREMKEEYAAMSSGDAKRREEFNRKYCSDLRDMMNRSDVHPFFREMFREAIRSREEGYSQPTPDFNFHNAAYG